MLVVKKEGERLSLPIMSFPLFVDLNIVLTWGKVIQLFIKALMGTKLFSEGYLNYRLYSIPFFVVV